MNMDRPRMIAASQRRAGFTLVEIMMVGGLMAFLAILLSSAWNGIGRSAVDAAVRSQLLQELDLAVASLGRDLGGSLPIPSSTPGVPDYGGKDAGRLVGCCPNDLGDQLELCYDAGPNLDGRPDWNTDVVIRYYLIEDEIFSTAEKKTYILIRSDADAGTTFPVARCVAGLSVSRDGDWTFVELTFTHPHPLANQTRKYTLKTRYLE
jgi:type II secretory pathway pseudopilin PulG